MQFNSDSQALARIPVGMSSFRLAGMFNDNWEYPWPNVFAKHNADQFVAQLKREGFELLGSGAFSVALTHPDWPDRVLKIETDCTGAAPDYWSLCLNKRLAYDLNPHMPEVYATGYLSRLDGELLPFVWMKRYQNGDANDKRTLVDQTVWDGCAETRLFALPAHLEAITDRAAWVSLLNEAASLGGKDLHRGNIMYDPTTYRYIITDPVC